ncbi:serine/threonine protein kinase, partial [Escherichia coli]|nr:serine/threonine protein kinase [Escherichia coli]EKF3062225.1 serine/threonine protein kinase [Escherichia coli]ELD9168650.1 serine/threonine protein kinase [Escherichia coli]HAL9122242.1 serine/threonine protein kinase [Escherichia coli]HAL9549757.1 serine/threonine protein kinase [Escherichia coli]
MLNSVDLFICSCNIWILLQFRSVSLMEEQHGNYFIKRIQLIGRGAFGFVEHVKVYNLNKGECGDYARKVLAPEKPELLAQIEQFRRRFKREVVYQSH